MELRDLSFIISKSKHVHNQEIRMPINTLWHKPSQSLDGIMLIGLVLVQALHYTLHFREITCLRNQHFCLQFS